MIKPKILFVILLAVIASVGVIFYVSWNTSPISPPQTEERTKETSVESKAARVATDARLPAAQKKQGATTNSVVANPSQTNSTLQISNSAKLSPEAIDAIVKAKTEQLQELSRKSDPASMKAILAEVKSPYPEVRGDAIEAIIQFRSRDAIPALKELAAQTDNTEDKIAILEAVEFLELPTLDELRANLRKTRGTNAAAQVAPK